MNLRETKYTIFISLRDERQSFPFGFYCFVPFATILNVGMDLFKSHRREKEVGEIPRDYELRKENLGRTA